MSKFRHGAPYEGIKQGNGKSQIAVRGAVDHALVYEFGPGWPDTWEFHRQCLCNLAAALRSRTEFRHCAEKPFLPGSQAIKTNPEKFSSRRLLTVSEALCTTVRLSDEFSAQFQA